MYNIDGQNLKCLNAFGNFSWPTNSPRQGETNTETAGAL